MLDSRQGTLTGAAFVENQTNTTQSWRFGIFEVDARNNELRRGGAPIKVREQSFRILVFLLEHAGELVTREDLQRALWSSDTFVDFDHGLNTAVMKLREALGDSADKSLYIETVPKRGYRFIAPVSREKDQTLQSEFTPISPPETNGKGSVMTVSRTVVPAIPAKSEVPWRRWLWPLAAVALVALGVGYWYLRRPLPPPRITDPVRLTLDGRRKNVVGTDGNRLYLEYP